MTSPDKRETSAAEGPARASLGGVVGVLVCEVLEEEMAYLLSLHTELTNLFVVESDDSAHLRELLQQFGRRAQELQDAAGFVPTGDIDVLVRVLRVALHMDKGDLRQAVRDGAEDLARHSDVLALGYGMCGNVLEKPEELLADLDVPLVLPRNDDGSIIDDCVCLVLGGTGEYLEQVYKEAGTWFLTPGWLRHWETLLVKELHAQDIPTVKWIFDRTGYKRALMVDTGVSDKTAFTAESRRFADIFNFRLEETAGSLRILDRQLEEAKGYLGGRSRRPAGDSGQAHGPGPS
jgi:hypothetical protein